MPPCSHHDWLQPGSRLAITTVMEDWLGPVMAVITCSKCGQPALIHLVAWQGAGLNQRIFGVRELDADATRTYLHNISRDYCDLTRKQSETEALLQAAAPDACLVETGSTEIVVKKASDARFNTPFQRWQDIQPESWSDWQKKLG